MENKKEDVLEEKKSRRSRRNREEKSSGASNLPYIGIAATAVILTLGAGIGFYFAKSGAYQETFMPNTTINGMNVAGMDIDEVKAMIEEELIGYELKILDRTGAGEVIAKDEIGLRTEYEGGLEQILAMQEPMMWIKSLWTEVDYRIGTILVYDEELLAERIGALSFMDETQMEEPQDAYLSDYQFDTNSYEIVAQTEGTELVKETVTRVIGEAILNLQEEIDLEEAGCYTKAAISSDDPELTALAGKLNGYVGTVVTHRFGESEEVLDGDVIHQWLTADGAEATIDESKVTEYVRALAKKYNTAYGKRPFLTTYGDVVTIPGGSYGWRMNETAEVNAVLEALNEGAVRTREPEWLQEGASHGEYDYGDTYVEVNLTGQHLFFYKNGELLVECDFVSGNAAKGWSTPAGIFPLTYKERNATLRGEGYATPVSYWMPFNGGIGLHDADWRGSFGGAIYKTNGSHGCINLPPKAAQIIYENISKGDPVVCYHLDGTETKKTSKASEINTSGAASVGNAAVGAGTSTEAAAKPAETKPAVQQTKPAETSPQTPVTPPDETTQAQPQTPPMETSPAQPQTPPIETSPAQPQTPPTETSPAQPEATSPAPPAETGGNIALTPETGGAITETRPAGPGAESSASAETMTPETGGQMPVETVPAITETRPAGVGPGSGPVGSGSTGTGPASAGPMGPGYEPNGPGGIGSVTAP